MENNNLPDTNKSIVLDTPHFGKEEDIDFQKYKEYVMKGFSENATNTPMDLMHCCVGFAAEAGEVLDEIKKFTFHNKPMNKTEVILEFGDAFWYQAALMCLLDISLADILAANKIKLDERYKNGRQDLMFRDTKLEYTKAKDALEPNKNLTDLT